MDLLAPLLAYALALTIAAVIPGPGIAALVGQALGSGLRPALFFLAGMALGDIAYLTCAVVGLAALVQVFAGALLAIKLLGAAYLLYLAWRFWTSKAGMTRVGTGSRTGPRAFAAGFAVTLGNPKTIIFYMALLPSVLDLRAVGPGTWAALAALTVAVLFATLTPYVLLAHRARRAMATTGALTRLNRWAAGIIGAAGALILGQVVAAATRRT
ncbi:MAG: LysE family translocator [Paracoccaceae bacterium]